MVPDRASAKTGRKHKSRRLRHPLPVPPKPDRTLQCAAYRRYGTPIYDIKPYIPYADSHPEARGSFATAHRDDHLQVQFPPELLNKVPQQKQKPLIQILALDPRPAYQQDPERIYGFPFAGLEIKFRVEEETLYVCEVNEEEKT